jgi:hypothetical protein
MIEPQTITIKFKDSKSLYAINLSKKTKKEL